MEIRLDVCTPEGKTWLARLVGKGGQFGVDRDFINAVASDLSRSGMTGTKTYEVTEDGVYESHEGRRSLRPNNRRYWILEGGVLRQVERAEAMAALDG